MTAAAALTVVVNGEPRAVARSTTIAALLAELGVAVARVAVERNLEIVPKSQYLGTALSDGDRIEIVHFVGGG